MEVGSFDSWKNRLVATLNRTKYSDSANIKRKGYQSPSYCMISFSRLKIRLHEVKEKIKSRKKRRRMLYYKRVLCDCDGDWEINLILHPNDLLAQAYLRDLHQLPHRRRHLRWLVCFQLRSPPLLPTVQEEGVGFS